ncbi:uncharacterized protein LOC111271270 [Varroa jacobsoni]|uniref:uncharacterized protein LOC111271270 n=1 Tax=Varroa jacobsoni TaxID=62625 RepID=UPI000BF5DCCD|nr:uncharacterized protein LOC111271270 [Varroa jacobsoni]
MAKKGSHDNRVLNSGGAGSSDEARPDRTLHSSALKRRGSACHLYLAEKGDSPVADDQLKETPSRLVICTPRWSTTGATIESGVSEDRIWDSDSGTTLRSPRYVNKMTSSPERTLLYRTKCYSHMYETHGGGHRNRLQ